MIQTIPQRGIEHGDTGLSETSYPIPYRGLISYLHNPSPCVPTRCGWLRGLDKMMSVLFSLRLSLSEYQKLEKMAKIYKMSVSEYVEKVLRADLAHCENH